MGELVILAAVIMGCSIPITAIWTRHRKETVRMQIEATAEKAAQYAASNQQLEDRLQVLERIVTDKGFDVAAQIEALRDLRPAKARLEAAEIEEKS